MSVGSILRQYNARLTLVDGAVWLIHRRIGVCAYDFDVEAHLACTHPHELPERGVAIARVGPLHDYPALYAALAEDGLFLANDPAQYARATDLTVWYQALEDLTPRSRWWPEPPSSADVASDFEWPVFVKGERQTNRHDASSVVRTPAEFDELMKRWHNDDVLAWQQVVVREFVDLRRVDGGTGSKVAPSFEFRTFWWHGALVGAGRYWDGLADYDWSAGERQAGLAVAREAARRMDVDFLVVDIAQTAAGDWIVIELNEGQESGYAGVPRLPLWRAIISEGHL